jgi:hypothetical protein
MQEIKHDGSDGIYKEGNIKDLLPEIEESLKKKDVREVIVSRLPGKKSQQVQNETWVRKIVREELKALLMERDPMFQKIVRELKETPDAKEYE